MRLLLILVLALGVVVPVSAEHGSKDHWAQRLVVVYDYTQPELDGYLPIIVRNWNLALGDGGLRLRYEDRPSKDCRDVDPIPDAIVVCSAATHDTYAAGATWVWVGKRHRISKVKTLLVASTWGTSSSESGYWWHPMGCHEMGHALGLDHPNPWQDITTCMSTQRQTPGTHDVAELRRMYGGTGGTVTETVPARDG